ncbi:hypothetical protein SAMN05216532_3117 [Streptomyces sp. 2231.1]|nr:hypothetical protein SAMN05216532_3117 [Streptomyces sp. 2231.1]
MDVGQVSPAGKALARPGLPPQAPPAQAVPDDVAVSVGGRADPETPKRLAGAGEPLP